jgi:hypothetical protein
MYTFINIISLLLLYHDEHNNVKILLFVDDNFRCFWKEWLNLVNDI